VKTGRGVRQGCCLLPIPFNLYSDYLTKEALEGFGDFKITRQVICTVKYADDFGLLVKEEVVLQGMTESIIEIGRWLWNGDECGKNYGDESLKAIQIMLDQKLLGNGDYFSYLGSVITSDARCRREIEFRISMAIAAFNKKKTLFTSKLDLNLRKNLVDSYILSIALLNKVFICISCSAEYKA
jgi:hypothetical protein